MLRRAPRRSALLVVLAVASSLVVLGGGRSVTALPNIVATDPATYAVAGRVFPDPHGCLSHDVDGDEVNDVVTPDTSPFAKGNVCVGQFLQYEEFVEGSKFLESMYPRFLDVVRLDEAYDNPNFRSAGLPRMVSFEDGQAKLLGRDRRPLYMLKVTDNKSSIPEDMRYHFVYSGSIHGIERAGAEGQIRAAEDLVTWAAKFPGKKIVETKTSSAVPGAADVLKRSVIYFVFPNPDGWGRGQLAPAEFEDGSPNLSYTPGFYFQRYNGNGMDLNRDFPTYGYTYRPYTPGSNPETKAMVSVLRKIRQSISPRNPMGQRFAGSIDLHGQLVADAFSYTLAGAAQRDFRKNFQSIDQSTRTYKDQSARLDWSPYIGDIFPAADQFGTTIDTIGYQITGSIGDWFENEEVGLGSIGLDNEMSLSHLAPNTVFEPITEQMHIDGNKALIYSQLSSMLTERPVSYSPPGKIGYVQNPKRVRVAADPRKRIAGLPAQDDIDVLVPCQDIDIGGLASCDEPGVKYSPEDFAVQFEVKGPKDGFFNGGITAQMTNLNALSMSLGSLARITLEQFDEGEWDIVRESFVQAGMPDLYLPGGQDVTINDPTPGLWRVRITNPAGLPARLSIDFNPVTAELSYGQVPIDASSMDFFTDMNKYIKDPKKRVEPISIDKVVKDPSSLDRFDSIVVVDGMGSPDYLKKTLKTPTATAQRYLDGLKSFATRGGNLVLTDAALNAIPKMTSVRGVRTGRFLAGRYEFGDTCNDTPLTKNVCIPGTAGGTSRQSVEPTPLGYTPDLDLDDSPKRVMPVWWVDSKSWNKGCGAKCTEATIGGDTQTDEGPLKATGLGQRKIGTGTIRMAGIMFPDPNYAPGGPADMRFGLASYALTFSAWRIFLNLVNYRR